MYAGNLSYYRDNDIGTDFLKDDFSQIQTPNYFEFYQTCFDLDPEPAPNSQHRINIDWQVLQ